MTAVLELAPRHALARGLLVDAAMNQERFKALSLTNSQLSPEQLWTSGAVEMRRALYFENQEIFKNEPQLSLLPGQDLKTYRQAYDQALAALCVNPLDPISRMRLLRLDFVGPDPAASQQLATQVAHLFERSTPPLLQVALLASANPGPTTAIDLWKQCLTLQPNLLNQIWNVASQTLSEQQMLELMPDNPELYVEAIEHLRLSPMQREQAIKRATELLESETGAPAVSSESYHLRARLDTLTESWKDAEYNYEMAILEDPTQTLWRYQYALILERNGKIDDAIREMHRCALQSPEEPRYATEERRMVEKYQR